MRQDDSGCYYPWILKDAKERKKVAYGRIPVNELWKFWNRYPIYLSPNEAMKKYISEFGCCDDNPGQIVPTCLNGSGSREENIFPQNARIDNNYNALERTWVKTVKNNESFDIQFIYVFHYHDDDERERDEHYKVLDDSARKHIQRPVYLTQIIQFMNSKEWHSEQSFVLYNPTGQQCPPQKDLREEFELEKLLKNPDRIGGPCSAQMLIQKHRIPTGLDKSARIPRVLRQSLDGTTIEKFINEINIKYDWYNRSTGAWIVSASEAMNQIIRQTTRDYDNFNTTQFGVLQLRILASIFPINPGRGIKEAFTYNNILYAWSKEKRKMAKKIRVTMEKIAGEGSPIKMQCVPIFFRHDSLVTKDSLDSQKIIGPNSPKFIDERGRQYKNWDDFLNSNCLPQGMMCYPEDGFLRGVTRDINGKHIVDGEPQVKFNESPSCTFLQRGLDKLDKVIGVALPCVSIVSIFFPPVAIAATWISAYSLMRQAMNIGDKWIHGEDYGAQLFNFVTQIAIMAVLHQPTKYAKKAVIMGRELSTIENVAITLALVGMKAVSISSVIALLISFATKPELTNLDILNFLVSCQTLYNTFASPWTATELLKKVRAELSVEELQQMKKRVETEIKNTEKKLETTENETEKKLLTETLNEKTNERISLDQDIFLKDLMVTDILGVNTEKLNEIRGRDGRIVMVSSFCISIRKFWDVTDMDVEHVMKSISAIESIISFANGESTEFINYNNFTIHPRVISYLDGYAMDGGMLLSEMLKFIKALSDSSKISKPGIFNKMAAKWKEIMGYSYIFYLQTINNDADILMKEEQEILKDLKREEILTDYNAEEAREKPWQRYTESTDDSAKKARDELFRRYTGLTGREPLVKPCHKFGNFADAG